MEEEIFLDSGKLSEFFKLIKSSHDEVIAPVKKQGLYFFEKTDHLELGPDYRNTIYPPKKFFMPDRQEIFSYKNNNVTVNISKRKTAIIGMRPCDVNSKHVLDMTLITDPYYKDRRDNTTIIALQCTRACDNGFCTSLGTDKMKGGFDLIMTEIEGGYVLKSGSDKGSKILKSKIFSKAKESPEINLSCNKSINQGQIEKLKTEFHNPVFEEEAERCLSCAACTATCPTCYCFSVKDDPELDVSEGKRIKRWSSCQLKHFTKVAGGFVFRKDRHARLRNFVYHKLDYYMEEHKVHLCVGCGRCITNCPTGIDITEIVNRL